MKRCASYEVFVNRPSLTCRVEQSSKFKALGNVADTAKSDDIEARVQILTDFAQEILGETRPRNSSFHSEKTGKGELEAWVLRLFTLYSKGCNVVR
ncbi:hypothetical protein V6N13_111765 [Hibiscus sabdariffa]